MDDGKEKTFCGSVDYLNTVSDTGELCHVAANHGVLHVDQYLALPRSCVECLLGGPLEPEMRASQEGLGSACPSYRMSPLEVKALGDRTLNQRPQDRRLPDALSSNSQEYLFLRSGVDYEGPRPSLYVEYAGKTTGQVMSALIEHVGARSYLLWVTEDGTVDLSVRTVI